MQIDFFSVGCNKPYRITKPIRLIELFAGIGSQAKALKKLGANFEHYRICEFDKYAVQSYNAIHGTNFEPTDITKITADDLGITETDKYEYIMTYSFPCQDLSKAGKMQGMAKGSGTRSGLLWEVERLLSECSELPQVLIMENVPEVLNGDFGGWLEFLESKGYHNYYKCLNAKNYGIPQNRKRCFMVSVLGDYYYDFPKPIPLELRLKDMLESKVDEKYYLSEKLLSCLKRNEANQKAKGNTFSFEPKDINGVACTIRANASFGTTDNAILDKDVSNKEPTIIQQPHGYNKEPEPVCINSKVNGKQPSLCDMVYDSEHISTAITTAPFFMGKVTEPIIAAMRGRNPENTSDRTAGSPTEQRLETGGSVSNTLTSVQKDNLVMEPIAKERFFRQAIETANKNSADNQIANTLTCNVENMDVCVPGEINVVGNYSPSGHEASRIVHPKGIAPTIKENHGTVMATVEPNYRIRKLTPKECYRLMGFDDSDFYKAKAAGVSDSQLYKQAGNSIVVNVLEAIFKKLF